MTRKRNLPLFSEVFEDPSEGIARTRKPSVDAARARLGGRPTESPSPALRPGAVVSVRSGGPAPSPGIVLWASAREAHVLLDGSRLKRIQTADVDVLTPSAPPPELSRIASDARMFAMLAEGQAVRYADDKGGLEDGSVVEKCRYGALVLRGDGTVVAVGFRKLFPAPTMGAGTA